MGNKTCGQRAGRFYVPDPLLHTVFLDFFHVPFKGPKHHRGLKRRADIVQGGAAVDVNLVGDDLQGAAENGEGDETRKPEEHRQGIKGENGHDVRDAREESRGQGEVEEGEEGPDGDEDHEVVLRGRVAKAGDWGVLAAGAL